MTFSYQPAFIGNPLDRADHLRADSEIFGKLYSQDTSRHLIMANDMILSDENGDIAWQTNHKTRDLAIHERVFLGLMEETLCYALSLEGSAEEYEGVFDGAKFRDVRGAAMKLTGLNGGKAPASLGIVAQAKSMLSWHQNHQYCAKCGEKSEIKKAGYERICPACKTHHFPRTDPVVIMLITDGDRVLMGRGAHFPPGFFSALAGFMEPGETIEDAVKREVYEEASIEVTNVRYIMSQPWPWPSSLMIGCIAEARTTDIKINDGELEDVRWFKRSQIDKALKGESPDFFTPPPIAIAHSLLKSWLHP